MSILLPLHFHDGETSEYDRYRGAATRPPFFSLPTAKAYDGLKGVGSIELKFCLGEAALKRGFPGPVMVEGTDLNFGPIFGPGDDYDSPNIG